MARRRGYNAASAIAGVIPGDLAVGFSARRLKRGAVIVAGAFGTSWLAGKIVEKLGITNKLMSTGVTLLTAGIASVGSRYVNLSKETADGILAGGMIAGATEGLSGIFPAYIKPIGMSDWAAEMGHGWSPLAGMNDEATTRQVRNAFALNDSADMSQTSHHLVAGMNSWATPSPGHQESAAGMGAWRPGYLYKGTSDYGGPQAPHFQLQGVRPGFNGAADAAVAEHIESM